MNLIQWNLNSFGFKFDDTRLFSQYKNKIGPIKKNCCVRMQEKNRLIGPILFFWHHQIWIPNYLGFIVLILNWIHPLLYSQKLIVQFRKWNRLLIFYFYNSPFRDVFGFISWREQTSYVFGMGPYLKLHAFSHFFFEVGFWMLTWYFPQLNLC